jgi:transcriptional regulator with XRE-family HTH domain
MNRDLQAASDSLSDTLEFIKKSFGRVLRAKRRRAGLTQRDLAKASKIRPETVSRLESGHGNPTLDTLMRLMKVVER